MKLYALLLLAIFGLVQGQNLRSRSAGVSLKDASTAEDLSVELPLENEVDNSHRALFFNWRKRRHAILARIRQIAAAARKRAMAARKKLLAMRRRHRRRIIRRKVVPKVVRKKTASKKVAPIVIFAYAKYRLAFWTRVKNNPRFKKGAARWIPTYKKRIADYNKRPSAFKIQQQKKLRRIIFLTRRRMNHSRRMAAVGRRAHRSLRSMHIQRRLLWRRVNGGKRAHARIQQLRRQYNRIVRSMRRSRSRWYRNLMDRKRRRTITLVNHYRRMIRSARFARLRLRGMRPRMIMLRKQVNRGRHASRWARVYSIRIRIYNHALPKPRRVTIRRRRRIVRKRPVRRRRIVRKRPVRRRRRSVLPILKYAYAKSRLAFWTKKKNVPRFKRNAARWIPIYKRRIGIYEKKPTAFKTRQKNILNRLMKHASMRLNYHKGVFAKTKGALKKLNALHKQMRPLRRPAYRARLSSRWIRIYNHRISIYKFAL